MSLKRQLLILFHQVFCLLVGGAMLIGALRALIGDVFVSHQTTFGILLLLGSFAWFKLLYDSEKQRAHHFKAGSPLWVDPNQSPASKEPRMALKHYSEGTRIKIGDRTFIRTATSTCWREEHPIPGNCITRPSASLEHIERMTGLQHVVIEPQNG
jgi:hypothetical protein